MRYVLDAVALRVGGEMLENGNLGRVSYRYWIVNRRID
jgi:hypothetical protein